MTGFALLLLVYRAVDNAALLDVFFNFLMTGNTQLSRLGHNMVGQIRAVRIMAQNAIAVKGRMKVTILSVEVYFFFVTAYAKLIALGDK